MTEEMHAGRSKNAAKDILRSLVFKMWTFGVPCVVNLTRRLIVFLASSLSFGVQGLGFRVEISRGLGKPRCCTYPLKPFP